MENKDLEFFPTNVLQQVNIRLVHTLGLDCTKQTSTSLINMQMSS